jgi:hypothetical protein
VTWSQSGRGEDETLEAVSIWEISAATPGVPRIS